MIDSEQFPQTPPFSCNFPMEEVGVGIWEWLVNSSEISFDEGFRRIFGFPERTYKVSVQEILDRCHPDDQVLIEQAKQEISCQQVVCLEYRIIANDRIRFITDKWKTLPGPTGQPERMVGVVIETSSREGDIGKEDEARQALEHKIERYELALEASETGLYDYDIPNDKVSYGKSLRKLFGLDPSRMVGPLQEFIDCVHPDERERIRMEVESIFKNAKDYHLDFRIVLPDGRIRYFASRGTVLVNAEGKSIRAVGMTKDITEVLHMEESMAQQTEELADLYQNAPCGYHSLDKDGLVVRMNDTELRWHGYSREELVNKLNYRDLLPPRSIKQFEEEYPKFLNTGRLKEYETELLRKDGSTFPVLLSASAINDATGKFLMCRTTVFDITDHKKAEEAAKLQLLLKQRDQFIAMLSHDMKNANLGCLRLLGLFLQGKIGTLTAQQAEYLTVMTRTIESQLKLSQDLVDAYRFEAGANLVQQSKADLSKIVQTCCQELSPEINNRAIQIVEYYDPDLKPIQADTTAIQRVVQNLLHNAQKFSPVGSLIEVCVKVEADQVLIVVSDRGPGIPEDEQPHLFQRFWQGGPGKKYKTGSGLGLYLSKLLVEAHGGQITYHTREGGGATFTVSLPAGKPVHEVGEGFPVEPITVLLVEDSEITRLGLQIMLEQIAGISFLGGASDGESGCKMVAELKPNIVLLDIGLPGINGIETCKQIRDEQPDTLVIMLTSHTSADEILASIAAGASGYCLKDISTEELGQALRTVAKGGAWLDERLGEWPKQS